MEFVPVLKIVQAHPIFWSGSVVGNAARAQNTVARPIIVIISAHRSVVLLDGLPGQRFGVFLYPRFKFGIARLVLLDVILDRLFIEPERGKRHRIEAFADAGITEGKFPRCFKRDLLPEAREMDNSEWPGNAGTDQWNIRVAHNEVIVALNNQPSTLNLFESQRREDNSIRLRYGFTTTGVPMWATL